MMLLQEPKRPRTTCTAVRVCGGGKKAKRRGDQWIKWHCFTCGISGWMTKDLKTLCEKKSLPRG